MCIHMVSLKGKGCVHTHDLIKELRGVYIHMVSLKGKGCVHTHGLIKG